MEQSGAAAEWWTAVELSDSGREAANGLSVVPRPAEGD